MTGGTLKAFNSFSPDTLDDDRRVIQLVLHAAFNSFSPDTRRAGQRGEVEGVVFQLILA